MPEVLYSRAMFERQDMILLSCKEGAHPPEFNALDFQVEEKGVLQGDKEFGGFVLDQHGLRSKRRSRISARACPSKQKAYMNR